MSTSIVRLDQAMILKHLSEFCEVLRDAVEGGASVSFVAPLAVEVNRDFWLKVAGEVGAVTRIVVAALVDGVVVGCVHLVPAGTLNGQHRAEVQKVLVHRDFRRRGLAQAMMDAIENEARKIGRWLLVLDTEEGSMAEGMYEKLGYSRAGGVPEFALGSDGTYRANVYFFKRLP